MKPATAELVRELRAQHGDGLSHEAADLIERLSDQQAKLVAALRDLMLRCAAMAMRVCAPMDRISRPCRRAPFCTISANSDTTRKEETGRAVRPLRFYGRRRILTPAYSP